MSMLSFIHDLNQNKVSSNRGFDLVHSIDKLQILRLLNLCCWLIDNRNVLTLLVQNWHKSNPPGPLCICSLNL